MGKVGTGAFSREKSGRDYSLPSAIRLRMSTAVPQSPPLWVNGMLQGDLDIYSW